VLLLVLGEPGHQRPQPRADRAELLWRSGDLFRWVAKGELNARVGAEYPIADAPRAHEDLAGRRTTGKLILVP